MSRLEEQTQGEERQAVTAGKRASVCEGRTNWEWKGEDPIGCIFGEDVT
jgi:hypothetical protein